jgi:hypothetical protein
MTKYKVSIDNGANYCGGLPGTFDTYKDAEDAGNDWLQQFYIDNDILPEDQEDDEAGFDVHEVEEVDTEGEGWNQDEELRKAALDHKGRP